ncbi:MAG: queuosine salvage family protein [Candidatus Yanofskybacteria bacterium]|nr:queuosine salvage family protein [Candidatus Yanofskybacteria bacterium]
MNFPITKPDPFHILASSKNVMEQAKFVSISQQAVGENVKKIGEYLKEHADFPDHGHWLTGDYETDLQLIFFENMMGFCFWTIPGKPKWGIEMPNGEKVDGWYGVCASFKRAHDEEMPVTDANFWAKAERSDIERVFQSATEAKIPLLDERARILNENGKILQEHFGGRVENLLQAAGHDIVLLTRLLLERFPSYRDIAVYNGEEVVFLKLVHLLALDLEYRLTSQSQRPFLKNFDQLCVFADYKLPQLLRAFGVLGYAQQLAGKVDSYQVIPKGSAEEVEMRAGAVLGIELLRQQLPEYSSIQIGHVVWLMSQDQNLQSQVKPYHRTYTTYY